MKPTDSDVRRFWAKVALPDENGCMLWLASVCKDGYGKFAIERGHTLLRAPGFSLWLASGPARPGQEHAAHSCRNRRCVAPAHLRWATKAENEADKIADGSTKLTAEQALEIRRRFTPGPAVARLAAEYGVSHAAVRKIASGQIWAWVQEEESA